MFGCMSAWVGWVDERLGEEVDWVEHKDGQVSDRMNGSIDGSYLNGSQSGLVRRQRGDGYRNNKEVCGWVLENLCI